MRIAALCLALLPGPALGWEFSPTPVCTLTHAAAASDWTVTYDPAIPEYAIAITLSEGTWPDAPAFGIRFDGPRALTIGTDRQTLSEDGRTLTVTDSGFGNVLDGLQFNTLATAVAGGTGVTARLDDAAPAVEAFRRCPADGLA